MPSGIGRMTCLQTLTPFAVGRRKGHRLEELGCLRQLRGSLELWSLENVSTKAEAMLAKLQEKENISEVNFHWSYNWAEKEDNSDEAVLDGLAPPHQNLKKTDIYNFRSRKFPSWVMSMSVPNPQGGLSKLEQLSLVGCSYLEQIPTLGHLPCLKILRISYADMLTCIGSEFYGRVENRKESNCKKEWRLFPALEEFTLSSIGLEKWEHMEVPTPEYGIESIVIFPFLHKLTITDCHELITIPSHFPSLRSLEFDCCEKFTGFAGNADEQISTIGRECTVPLPHLEKLTIKGCSRLTTLPIHFLPLSSAYISRCEELSHFTGTLDGLTSSRNLVIQYCPKLMCLPSGLQSCTSLKELEISDCSRLTTLPIHISSLCSAYISRCEGLSHFIGTLDGLTSLRNLVIHNCPKLMCLPSGLQSCTSLKELKISECSSLTSIPGDLQALCSLVSLKMQKCEMLTLFPEKALGYLAQLKSLNIGGFSDSLQAFPGLISISCLRATLAFLTIRGWKKLMHLPDQIQHLASLERLVIDNFEELEALPDWLDKLSSLKSLKIWECYKLKLINSKETLRRLPKLKELDLDVKGLHLSNETDGNESDTAFLSLRLDRRDWDKKYVKTLSSLNIPIPETWLQELEQEKEHGDRRRNLIPLLPKCFVSAENSDDD